MFLLGIPASYVCAALLSVTPTTRPPCIHFDSPPTPTCDTTFVVEVGGTVTFTVQASDETCASPVLLEGAGLEFLIGASITPPLPALGNPVSVTVSWTPGIDMLGTHNIVFRATSGCCGDQVFCNFHIEVTPPVSGCALTPGFWKTHVCSWPEPFAPGEPSKADANHNGIPDTVEGQCGSSKTGKYAICKCDPTNTMLLGTIAYDQCELLCALAASAGGNAVRILGIQLIATKLNAITGATTSNAISDPLDPSNPYNGFTIDQLIVEADALLGGTNVLTGTVAKNDPRRTRMIQVATLLALFNNGFGGVPHCG